MKKQIKRRKRRRRVDQKVVFKQIRSVDKISVASDKKKCQEPKISISLGPSQTMSSPHAFKWPRLAGRQEW